MATFTIDARADLYASAIDSYDAWTLTRLSATRAVFEAGDYRLVLSGTEFASGTPAGGTITGMRLESLHSSSGSTVATTLMRSTGGLSLSLAGLQDALAGSNYTFAALQVLFEGNDTLTGTARGNALIGYAGNDRLSGGDGNDVLNGDSELVARSQHGNDVLSGGNGNDRLDGGGGADRMTGGAGDDLYVVEDAGDRVIERAGGGAYDRVRFSNLDGLQRYELPAQVENLDLVHYVDLNASPMVAVGNGLANRIAVTAVYGGSSGVEALYGLGGNDRLVGGAGTDRLDGGTGADTMVGGLGSDTYVVDELGDGVVEAVSLAGGALDRDTVVIDLARAAVFSLGSSVSGLRADRVYSGIETLDLGSGSADHAAIGSPLADRLIGNAGDNRLHGGAGDDALQGGAGRDLLYGGSGNDRLAGDSNRDTLSGGAGQDTLSGGTGSDTYYVDDLGDVVREARSATQRIDNDNDTLIVSLSSAAVISLGSRASGYTIDRTWRGIETLQLAGSQDHVAIGSGLADALIGNRGDNTLFGAAGNDLLRGGRGADTLSGGDGNDRLYGDAGADRLRGGSGADRYVWTATSESTPTHRDTVVDFTSADTLDLRGIDANTRIDGNQRFSYIGSAGFDGDNAAGQLRFANGVLYGSTDADADAEFAITLTGLRGLSADDILL